MVRAVNKLTAIRIKSLKKPGRYSDGDGLYLYISKTGNRSWIFRYRDRGTSKLRDKGLGPIRDVGLEQAREAARAARSDLRAGVDPIDTKQAERARAQHERLQGVTFGQCTDRYLEAHRSGWKNAKHAAQWRSTLDGYAAALLPLPVRLIDTPAVLSVLEPVWASRTETATRVRQRIESVLDWAAARNYRTGENPARWKGHLDKLLPKPTKLKTVTPRAALRYELIGAFIEDLREQEGMAAKALELQILTATRPGEVVGAKWSEFDLKAATWTVPARRMKAGKEHRIPLAPAAATLLKALLKASADADGFVFPGSGKNESMTTAAPLKVLKDMRAGMTAHGFRSTFRDWAADMTAYPREIAEQALAHSLPDRTEAAYRRSDLFAKRANLMADWATYCATPAPSDKKVASLAHARKKRRAG